MYLHEKNKEISCKAVIVKHNLYQMVLQNRKQQHICKLKLSLPVCLKSR